MERRPTRICFVCLGNICRSPTAQGVMQKLIDEAALGEHVLVDSAGTAAYHEGERADPRSRAEALRRGVELTSIARRFDAADFDRFDYVVAMDRQNLAHLERMARDDAQHQKLSLLRDHERGGSGERDVPDPYYGGGDGFARVFEIVERGCRGLLASIRRERGL